MRDAEDLLREVHDLLDGGVVQEPAAPAEDPPPRQPEREQVPVVPRRAVAGRRHRPRRRAARVVLVIVVALAAVAAGVLTVRELRTSGPRNGDRPATAPAVPQDVLAWTVWTEQPTRAYVAVLATSEDLEPVALTVPGHLIVSIPGRGVGTIGDAAAGGNAELVGTTVSSVLGVEVDETVASSLEELGGIVDALGGIDIGEGRSSGARVVRYLRAKDRDADFRAIRWQEVLDGLLAATAARPRVLAGALPRDAARIVTSAGVGGARAIDLPVVEAGSGLVRAEAEAVAALARERFARTARTAEPVRLVVLNGNGIPGIGERVARKLVPAGFRLVSSQNASTFDVKETLIAATDERFLDEARLARELLGVGRVALDPQSSRVAEVTVIVGRDFRAA